MLQLRFQLLCCCFTAALLTLPLLQAMGKPQMLYRCFTAALLLLY
jgi:hypothetical protein